MEHNLTISKEEYAVLIQEETKLEMIERVLTDRSIKYSSDIIDHIKFILGIKNEEAENND